MITRALVVHVKSFLACLLKELMEKQPQGLHLVPTNIGLCSDGGKSITLLKRRRAEIKLSEEKLCQMLINPLCSCIAE